jgi:hypothetical protein
VKLRENRGFHNALTTTTINVFIKIGHYLPHQEPASAELLPQPVEHFLAKLAPSHLLTHE